MAVTVHKSKLGFLLELASIALPPAWLWQYDQPPLLIVSHAVSLSLSPTNASIHHKIINWCSSVHMHLHNNIDSEIYIII